MSAEPKLGVLEVLGAACLLVGVMVLAALPCGSWPRKWFPRFSSGWKIGQRPNGSSALSVSLPQA